MKVGLYLFENDCRLSDNPALTTLAPQVDTLICIYLPTVNLWTARKAQCSPSFAVECYRNQTLNALHQSLVSQQQKLYLLRDTAQLKALTEIIHTQQVTHIGRTVHPGFDEQKLWLKLQDNFPHIQYISAYSNTLFEPNSLPISVSELPQSFTPFRKVVEEIEPNSPIATAKLPPRPNRISELAEFKANSSYSIKVAAGEAQAQQQLQQYFQTDAALTYKETRNALFGEYFSTRFSPILAYGAISPRQIKQALTQFEQQRGANESTYWIWFELLWREYFYWYALKHQHRLFCFSGVKAKTPKTSFYPERFLKWCQGRTPSALVNAIMHELTKTGWISNRARQIAASYCVNELQLDWRYGAAFFEQHLIDYDVAANWGNWQYIAGVGADPRGGRHFNITKQQALFDPDGEYIKLWQGEATPQLDSQDHVGWPLEDN
ncbi:deoxyribodipyrimidine photolyase [Pseudoalteromonas sp. BMB]|uniref:DASH family cryptochrome n=1 Tax=Pseudoalteromonas sp. BMB TaxID=1874619 RepID=UPI00083D2CB2|nr:DASH family cryptochrome [Pseudoalteromonas sp. BMB]ODB36547.1 deoxyribodipyrimidine photolyase [Pseudoalteromonas sp. BMB]